MARMVRNPKIDTRSARARLAGRREPYWTVLSAGCALGYRGGAKGGTWIARFRGEGGRQHYSPLGAADDARDPDGLSVFGFSQAQERARQWFDQKAREQAGEFAPLGRPYTIADALSDYRADYLRRGGKGGRSARFLRRRVDKAGTRLPGIGEVVEGAYRRMASEDRRDTP